MRHAFLALVLALTLPSAACTSVVEGSAHKGAGGQLQPAIDASQLDVGPFPTTPRQPLGVTGDPLRGIVVEAQRMANNVVGPWEVDPSVTVWFGFGAMALPNAASLALIGPGDYAAAAGRHNFINGFVSARTQEGKKRLVNTVLRFADDASATAATTELGAIAMREQGVEGPAQKVPIPGHPEAQANIYTIPDRDGGRWSASRSFTAHGPYVLMQLAQATDGVDAATQLVAKSIDLQGPEIDKFRATDPAEFADITIDPSGLLARTISANAEGDAAATTDTTYETRGALHFQNDPARSAKLFSDTGTDLVAMAKTNVYQTTDADGAKGVVDGFFDELAPNSQPANAVRNMPESRCLRLKEGSFYCLAPADRYAIEVNGANLLEAQQLVAAQYVILMNS
jgi:hypothetical protein